MCELLIQRLQNYLSHNLPIWTGIYVYHFLVDEEMIRALNPEHLSLTDAAAVSCRGQYLSHHYHDSISSSGVHMTASVM